MRAKQHASIILALSSLLTLTSCTSPEPVFSAVDVLRLQQILPFAVQIPRDAKLTDRIEIQIAGKDGPITARTAGRVDWFPGGIVKIFMREEPHEKRRFDVLGKYGDLTTIYVDKAKYNDATTLNMADQQIHPMGTNLAYYGGASASYPLPPNTLPPNNGAVVRVILRPATEDELRIDRMRGLPMD